MISDSLSSIIPSSSAISAIVEKSSLLKILFCFDLFISLVKNCNKNKTPVYLNKGMIALKKIEVNLTSLCQYVAPKVLGIISETSKMSIVMMPETIPTTKSSVKKIPKNSYVLLFIDE